jgi:predicted SprT family Zn-dependent metalloprotease
MKRFFEIVKTNAAHLVTHWAINRKDHRDKQIIRITPEENKKDVTPSE